MITHEEYLHLPLSNDFMFGEIMQDEEVQDGYVGHILPFELVQKVKKRKEKYYGKD